MTIRGGYGTPPQTKVVLVSRAVAKGKRPDRMPPDEYSADTGTFAFKDVVKGEYDVVACAGTEYLPQKSHVVVQDSRPLWVTLKLPAAGEWDKKKFWGVLKDRKTGNRLPNRPAAAYGYECEVAKGSSNERAEFEFNLPAPPDDYRFEVTLRGVVATGAARTTSTVVSLSALGGVVDLLLHDEMGEEPSLIAATLDNEPGVNKRWFEPGGSRPVVRGFDGERVLVTPDPTISGSASSNNVLLLPGVVRNNNFMLDGINQSSMDYAHHRPVAENELRLTREGSQRAGDAFSYKQLYLGSGGNQFHGRVGYGVRHDALDARNFFNLPGFDTFREQNGVARLSGPIRRDSAWFLLNYELDRGVEAPTFSPSLVLQLPALNSQFSRLGLPGENLRRFLTAGATDQPSVRLNYEPHEKHALSLRYDFRRGLWRNTLSVGPTGTSDAPSAAGTVKARNHLLSFGYRWLPSYTLTFDLRYDFRGDALSDEPLEPGQASLFIPGLARTGRAPDLLEGDGQHVNHLLSFEVQKTAGKHDLKGGAQFGLDRNTFRFVAFEAGRAVIPGLSSLSAPAPVADLFQLGRGGSQVAFNVSFQNYHGLYTYRALNNLTLNVGLQNKVELPPSFHRRELNGLQPRASLAWSINPDTLLRLGYVMTRTRLPQHPFGFELLLGGGLRTSLPPPARRVTSFIGEQAATSAFNQFLFNRSIPVGPQLATIYDTNSRSPVVQTASLSLQRELPHRVFIDVDYLFTRGSRLLTATNVNLPPPVLIDGRPDFQNAAVNPAFAQVYQFQTAGNSIYHGGSLTARVRHRSFDLGASYTLAKSIDDLPSVSFEGTPENVFDRRAERAVSSLHSRHVGRVWATWDKSFKIIRDQKVKHEGGVFVSGDFNYRSGGYFNVITGFDANHDGNPLTDRPLGVGRNTFSGQSFAQLNVLVGSRLRITEGTNVELRVQTFNLLNRANFATFNTVLGKGSLAGLDARIVNGGRGVPDYDFRRPLTPGGFGAATSAYTPRRLQLELRFNF